ncbi:hypothetical protein GCM10010149_48300 [Nonomuraea roseoviolacea subsp. roseoviolacea]|uniref:Uncharacterized protein n=1 Tax=Nonomuraea roseoviolacea subsp. carminata TaxID=160689 RepID=A0ABT1KGA9_9ACTN|nr:hypothetical protein [Nonomuraea roseoviolacea]MCP2352642.1 hypothetical protein [Nonomuraea roseoviolacea subsp. carminata]
MITEGVDVSGFVRTLFRVPVVAVLAVALGACGSEPAGPADLTGPPNTGPPNTGPGYTVSAEPGGGSAAPAETGSLSTRPSPTASSEISLDHVTPSPSPSRTRTHRPCPSGGGDPVPGPCPSLAPPGTPATTISAAQPTGTPDASTPSPQEDSSPAIQASPVPTPTP